MLKDYLSLFIDDDYPHFIDKYLNTKTLNRLKYITQFCGCDYTKLYTPLFLYTRFDHSLVVALMTWHFTHDKKQTIAALLHDVGTPCFAHCIDYVFGDYINQESSEKDITEIIKDDDELLSHLASDGISLEDLLELDQYSILENKSPQLCTDRLDGVLHTCYVWLHTHTLEEIKEVYNNMVVLTNEYGHKEIGFKDSIVALKFKDMAITYGKELQSNTDKYVMKYVSEIVKIAFEQNLITLEDLYRKKEQDIVEIFATNFPTWTHFNQAETLVRTDEEPDIFHISFKTKKRNTIPLTMTPIGCQRIIDISPSAQEDYSQLEEYQDTKYAYVKTISMIHN